MITQSSCFIITGKSGIVAERLAASLSSIGVSSEFVNAAEWSHGDLGICLKLYNTWCVSAAVSA